MKKLISSLILLISVFGIVVGLNNVTVSANNTVSKHSNVTVKKVSKKKPAKKYAYRLTNLKAKIVRQKVSEGLTIKLVRVSGKVKVSTKSLAKKNKVKDFNYRTCDGEWDEQWSSKQSKHKMFSATELGVLKGTKKSSSKHIWVTAEDAERGITLSATKKVTVKQLKK